jgi:dTDP-4-dehydrorhamnose reductase
LRLLVTGGTGYLGSELVRRGTAAGHQVTGTSTRDFDVRDGQAVEQAFARLAPAAVVHTAYRQEGPGFREINVAGAVNVARSAARAGARLIHVSTDVVFDGRRGGYTEVDPVSPVTEYGASKAAAEPLVAQAHPDALIVRTSLIYGGPDPSRHERDALDAAAGRARMTFFTDERRNPIQVGDLSDALLELVEMSVSGLLHVAGGDSVSRCEFARLIAAAEVPCGPSDGAPRPLDCTLDCSRARALLRTRLRGVREALA